MKYQTLCAEEVSNLDRKVTKALNEGWVLHGNVFIDGCRKCQVTVWDPPITDTPSLGYHPTTTPQEATK